MYASLLHSELSCEYKLQTIKQKSVDEPWLCKVRQTFPAQVCWAVQHKELKQMETHSTNEWKMPQTVALANKMKVSISNSIYTTNHIDF